MSRLPSPEVTRTAEALRSNTFGDIYFQEADGLAETRHVFIDGNDLAERFASHQGLRPFVIGELGFGTGLNFLAAAMAFERHAPPDARLDYWSAEGFPFVPDALREVLSAISQRWPETAGWARRLASAYPTPRPGQAQVQVSDRITLTLGFGPALEVLQDTRFEADAWFLDGFSPSTNPEMWSEDLMEEVARHTRAGGSFATFTVAGHVRRALTAAGFELERRTGFGKKREMLAGRREGKQTRASDIRRVAIIGAGIAGACAAHTARTAGLEVTVLDRDGPAAGASGNPGGLLMPRIEAQDNAAARFYRDAFLFALRFYETNAPEALTCCGGTLKGDPARFEKVLDTGLWAEGDLRIEHGNLISQNAGVLKPTQAVRTLLDGYAVELAEVLAVQEDNEGVSVQTSQGAYHFDAAIVAAGPASAKLLGIGGDMAASRGQVDLFDGPVPAHITTDGTYIAPLGSLLMAGATYDPAAAEDVITADDQSTELNRRAAETLLGVPAGEFVSRRASLRATTKDRHPIAGPMKPKTDIARVLALTGLGSRGLVTAPILAHTLIVKMMGGIGPLSKSAEAASSPDRFDERRLRRGQ